MTTKEAVEFAKEWDTTVKVLGDSNTETTRQFLSMAAKALENEECLRTDLNILRQGVRGALEEIDDISKREEDVVKSQGMREALRILEENLEECGERWMNSTRYKILLVFDVINLLGFLTLIMLVMIKC